MSNLQIAISTAVVADLLADAALDTLIAPYFEDGDLPAPTATLDAHLDAHIAELRARGDLSGKANHTLLLFRRLRDGESGPRRVLLLGLGKREKLSAESARRAAAVTVQKLRELKSARAAFLVTLADALSLEVAVQAAAEGALMGSYAYHGQKSSNAPAALPEHLSLALPGGAEGENAALHAIERGLALARASSLARTLANLPPNICTPAYLAEQSLTLAEQHGLRCEVLESGQMAALRMGALLGVARGSHNPPRFIVLEHNPDGAESAAVPLVLVGKGITFDTGGYSIKTTEGMVGMKADMSGAAAVLAAMTAIAALKLPQRTVGLLPCADNMISSNAYLPNEVLTASNGTTIEIISTDAEGRLVLADALVYAARYKPAAVVDIATLTGSIGVALGSAAAGLFSTDDGLRDKLIAAGEQTGERLWPMPIFSEYEKLIESKTADVKNSSGGRVAGASVGAVFLRKFTSYPAWAHIDMAGMLAEPTDNPTLPGGGASGYGARLLTAFVAGWR
jgi:leucyl aminopeptidase